MKTVRTLKSYSSLLSEVLNHYDSIGSNESPGASSNYAAPSANTHTSIAHRKRYSTATGRRVTYYEMMELTPKASQKQIKAAYYRLSKKLHPDVNAEPDAKEKFAMLSEAYEVLGSRRTRSLYDSGSLRPSDVGRQPSTQDGSDGGVDVEYQEFFKRRSPFKSRGPGQPPTGKTTIYDFDEFYRQHYGEQIRRSQEQKREREWQENEDELLKERQKRAVVIYCVCIMCAAVVVAFGGRGK